MDRQNLLVFFTSKMTQTSQQVTRSHNASRQGTVGHNRSTEAETPPSPSVANQDYESGDEGDFEEYEDATEEEVQDGSGSSWNPFRR